ncbi:DUF1566 domain-containing protein [candidate division CSSED10-310 bacterium]|uniref:DUF1566 domain-containing protein n=1 Tax=candidate division CSSED10-310 bacterium TaxID=2855610 RepID=A0ABV6Z3N8_UNCC1
MFRNFFIFILILTVAACSPNPTGSKKSQEKSQTVPRKIIREAGAFVVFNDGTLLDRITGLMWATTDNGSDISRFDADDFYRIPGWLTGKTCRIGGYTDWRLPTLAELSQVFDTTRDSYALMATKEEKVNVSLLFKISGTFLWAQDWDESHSGFYEVSSGEHLFQKPNSKDRIRVLPVRREQQPMPDLTFEKQFARKVDSNERFQLNDNGTVWDNKTELMWAAKDNGADIDWESARSYCQNLTTGDYNDWRLPTQEELASLYLKEYSYSIPQLVRDVHIIPTIKLSTPWVWSADVSGDFSAYVYSFDKPTTSYQPKTNKNHMRVLPVRTPPIRQFGKTTDKKQQ